MAKTTIDHVDVTSRRVIMRVDFNVPLDDRGNITDDRRIRLALPSITSVINRRGRLILISHLGRPKGIGPEPGLSLKPAAERLAQLLDGVTVRFIPDDCVGSAAAAAAAALGDGQILVLENLRFHKEEKKGDPTFAANLAAMADLYCNDAFGTAHRNHASMMALPRAMEGKPRVCGLLLQKELRYLSETIRDARRPFLAILGGAKVSDKLAAIDNLTGRVDHILIGGAMAYTFLKARGAAVGDSLVEDDMLPTARRILDELAGKTAELLLPGDHLCGRQVAPGTPTCTFTGDIEPGWIGLDIGPQTAHAYDQVIRQAKTVVWNGPMGVFELPPFDAGTAAVAKAIAKATAAGAVSVIGGGDSAAAIHALGLADQVSHVSTGGGASLEMLEGKSFDTVAVLDDD